MREHRKGIVGFSALLFILLVLVVGYAAYTVVSYEEGVDIGDSGITIKEPARGLESADDVQQELDELVDFDIDAELDTSELDAALEAF